MKGLVICPDRPAELPFLARKCSVALAPALGPSLLGHALTTLAQAGARHAIVLASDRPEQVRAAVGGGEFWGLKVEVIAETRELSVAEAREKYRRGDEMPWLEEGRDVLVADRPMDHAGAGFVGGAREWFEGVTQWLPEAHRHRVGAKEIQPGVWVGLRCRLDVNARLVAPCWLGDGVWVRARATVGPKAFVEDLSVIDHEAEVVESWVGPRTYVGAMTHLRRSLAWGSGLLNWESGSFVEVPDAFLLGELEGGTGFRVQGSVFSRLGALVAMGLSAPVVLPWVWWRARQGGGCCVIHRAVVPGTALSVAREVVYREFSGLMGAWKRWPQLWNVVRGEFCWVGNRPLTREQAAELNGEFEQLWLAAPTGLFSLADAEGVPDSFGEDARTHSAFYAAQADAGLDREILKRILRSAFKRVFR